MGALEGGGSARVQEAAVTAVAVVAQSAEAGFGAYYEPFMARLRPVVAHASVAREWRALRGRCIEAISLIGAAVGRERFGATRSR